jgi:hypothetical protein
MQTDTGLPEAFVKQREIRAELILVLNYTPGHAVA